MVACVQVEDFGLAVEHLDNPLLSGRAVALLHSPAQPLVMEVSPAARSAGVAPGMEWTGAVAACPELARVMARPERYSEMALRLANGLAAISPDIEPCLPGTVYIDLTHCQSYYRHDPARIAALLHASVREAGSPAAGVGISGDRTTAGTAARQAGPGGSLVVFPEAAASHLGPLTLEELCGAGPLVTAFLAEHGVHRCGDMARIPYGLLVQRFGNHGRRLWLMAQGRDPSPVRPRGGSSPADRGNVGLLRTLPPACRDEDSLHAALLQLAQKLLARLAREGWTGQELRVGLRAPEGWRRDRLTLPGGQEAAALAPALRRFLRRHWYGEEVRQLHLEGMVPAVGGHQADFFRPASRRHSSPGTV